MGRFALRAGTTSIRFMVKPLHVDNNERDAADLVSSVIGGSPELHDTGRISGRHDYNIVMPNGSVIALEVTRHTSQADHEFQGVLKKEKKRHWRFPNLTNDYSVTVGDRPVDRPSGNLLDTIYQCQQRQDWYRDYVRSSGMSELEWVASLQPDTPPEDAAQRIRSALSFNVQQRGADYQEAFTVLRQRAEELGVMVMVNGVVGSNTHRKLDPKEFRGFALVDQFAPLVFVNGSDTRAAQIFTLAHELAHVWLGESALDSVDLGARATNDIERWCNRVAAEILVPLQEIRAEFNPRVGISTELQRLARRFKTSRLVVLRRLHECEFLTWDEYQQTFQTEYEQALERVTGIGGDFYRTQPARVGTTFAQAVIASTLEGETSYTDAFQMLGFKKTSTFNELADRLGVT